MTYFYPILGAWLLWVMYLAVMNLKSARDRGALSKPAEYLGMTVLYPGLLLDVLINLVVMTILLLELPKEWTVTSRVSRHCHGVPEFRRGRTESGIRHAVAHWLSGYRHTIAHWLCQHLLNPFDPSGKHCK